MKIYICIPFNCDEEVVFIQKYFEKKLPKNDILVVKNRINDVVVYFMNSFNNSSKEEKTKFLFNDYFANKGLKIEFKINYSSIDANFFPETFVAEKKVDNKKSDEFDYKKLSKNFIAENPLYSFDQVVLSQKTLEMIENALGVVSVENKVFNEWGLSKIIPFASSALNFHGEPGTGKSMTAEAVANKLGKKIIKATYADIESKYHGEGPKMVKALFYAAEQQDAVLFLDESDSLLSKRLTSVEDGSAQAINSMRSQLLISLEHHRGLVIFATNLIKNYDKAFLSRLINVEFMRPSYEERLQIWHNHLYYDGMNIPLDISVDINELAKKFDFSGREIKNCIKNACIETAVKKADAVKQETFIKNAEKILEDKENLKI